MTDERFDDLRTHRQGRADVALPRPVQEHLARQLRAAYVQRQQRPAYLGDPALPATFDDTLSRLEANERARERQRASECGLAAVRTALDGPEPSGDRRLPTNS